MQYRQILRCSIEYIQGILLGQKSASLSDFTPLELEVLYLVSPTPNSYGRGTRLELELVRSTL